MVSDERVGEILNWGLGDLDFSIKKKESRLMSFRR